MQPCVHHSQVTSRKWENFLFSSLSSTLSFYNVFCCKLHEKCYRPGTFAFVLFWLSFKNSDSRLYWTMKVWNYLKIRISNNNKVTTERTPPTLQVTCLIFMKRRNQFTQHFVWLHILSHSDRIQLHAINNNNVRKSCTNLPRNAIYFCVRTNVKLTNWNKYCNYLHPMVFTLQTPLPLKWNVNWLWKRVPSNDDFFQDA